MFWSSMLSTAKTRAVAMATASSFSRQVGMALVAGRLPGGAAGGGSSVLGRREQGPCWGQWRGMAANNHKHKKIIKMAKGYVRGIVRYHAAYSYNYNRNSVGFTCPDNAFAALELYEPPMSTCPLWALDEQTNRGCDCFWRGLSRAVS